MKVLICGGNGFIGRNLVDHFSKSKNLKLRATYFRNKPKKKKGIEWIQADLRSAFDVKKVLEDVDVVLQYAATSTGAKDILSKPYMHVTDNAIMNSLLIRESFEKKIKHFIFPSCSIMYQPGSKSQKESDFNESQDIYEKYYGAGNTKVYLEKMCKFFSSLGETQFTVLRQSNIYGPYDKYNLENSHVLSATITKVIQSKDKITVWGDGSEFRDFLYVEDLINLIERVIDQKNYQYELFNASYGDSIRISDLVNSVVKISNKKIKIEKDLSKPSIPIDLFIDNKKAYDFFQWRPTVDIEQGLKKTIKWYIDNEKKLIN